ALGVVLYEMLTGERPFVGEDVGAIYGQQLYAQPLAPSALNAAIPAALEVLILRLLEKDPAQRLASAAHVRQALEALDVSAPLAEQEGRDLGRARYRRTFAGREAEVRQLRAAYEAAVAGQGALLIVVGEPGVGKTALCEQLASYVTQRGGRVLWG